MTSGDVKSEHEQLLQSWASLFETDQTASPFLSTIWTSQWLATYGGALAPTSFVWSTESVTSPDAVAVLACSTRRRGPILFRRIHLNTDGEAPGDSVIIENNRLLCRPELRRLANAALASVVFSSSADEFVASGLDGAALKGLLDAFPSWHPDIECRVSHYVDLELVRKKGGDPLSCLSPNTRSQVRRSIRKYEEVAPLCYDMAASEADAIAMLDELITLHTSYWRTRGSAGAFGSAKRREFHFSLVKRAVPTGGAHLMRIRCGEKTIGVLYSLTAHGLVNFYQSGFERPADPHFKPGLVSHCLAIRHFAAVGFREYDFLASAPGESRYKESLSTNQRPLYWLSLSRPNYKNAVLKFVRRAQSIFSRGGIKT